MTRPPLNTQTAGPAACSLLAIMCAVAAVRGYDGTAGLIRSAGFVAVVLAVLAAVVIVRAARVRLRTVGGRQMVVRTGPGHGPRKTALHEGGHIAVTRAVGGRVTSAHIYPDGSGITHLTMPRDASVVDDVAVDVAGEVAAGTKAGCGSDQALMRARLLALPPDQRSATRKAGYARARQVTGGLFSDGGVAAAARILLRDGSL